MPSENAAVGTVVAGATAAGVVTRGVAIVASGVVRGAGAGFGLVRVGGRVGVVVPVELPGAPPAGVGPAVRGKGVPPHAAAATTKIATHPDGRFPTRKVRTKGSRRTHERP